MIGCPYTVNSVAAAMARKGYKWYAGEYDLNLVGIRSADVDSNQFNDWLMAAHLRKNGTWASYFLQCTTDPGKEARRNPANVNGVAAMVPDQYPKLWTIGLHKGKYEALVQVGSVKVFRDNNRDDRMQFNPASIQAGVFGINCHHASADGTSTNVDRWSEGCQVVADSTDWGLLITLCKKQIAAGHGSTYTYTLLTAADVVV